MPCNEQSREDLSWTLKEILEGGGEGSISETRFVEGLADDRIIALFQNARKSDYENIAKDANRLHAAWSSGKTDPRDSSVKGHAQLSKLQRRMDNVAAIDFFHAPERKETENVIKNLAYLLTDQEMDGNGTRDEPGNLRGKTWVTRRNLFVDRLACGWLIRRFIDRTAVFKFIDPTAHSFQPDEIRFDMFDGEFTHEGDRCTFEVMIHRFGLQDRALACLAEVVHDIDLKDAKYRRNETGGFEALLTGMVASRPDDDQRLEDAMPLFENLYSYFQSRSGK